MRSTSNKEICGKVNVELNSQQTDLEKFTSPRERR